MSRDTQIQQLFYETLMESQYWPAERLREHQRQQLGRLLRHARAEVPFYEDRLDGVLDADGELDWDRWRQIPILRREDLLVHRDAMQAAQLSSGHGKTTPETTSGSTGKPVQVVHSQYASQTHAAATFRSHRWHDLDWSKRLLVVSGYERETHRLDNIGHSASWGPAWHDNPGPSWRLNPFVPAQDVLEFIATTEISYLSCRPKVAQALALEALRLGRLVALDAILSFGTAVQADESEDCRKAFGAKMLASYATTEARMIGYQCPAGDWLHGNDEQVLIELLDDEGRPVPPGVMGRVVVTPFFNFAQPLIRYDQGDLAVAGSACSCGRELTLLQRVVGRTLHLFKLPDGSRIAPRVPNEFRSTLAAQYWQLAQTGPQTIEVRYVPFEGPSGDEQAAARIVQEITHPSMQVTFRRQADIDRLYGGKFIEFVYEA